MPSPSYGIASNQPPSGRSRTGFNTGNTNAAATEQCKPRELVEVRSRYPDQTASGINPSYPPGCQQNKAACRKAAPGCCTSWRAKRHLPTLKGNQVR